MGLWGWSDSNPVSAMACHWDGREDLGIAKPRAPLCGAGIRVAVRFQRAVGHRMRSYVSRLVQGLVCNWLLVTIIILFSCFFWSLLDTRDLKISSNNILGATLAPSPGAYFQGCLWEPLLCWPWLEGRQEKENHSVLVDANDLARRGKAVEYVGEPDGSWGKWTLAIT